MSFRNQVFGNRLAAATLVAGLCFSLLLFRLWYLQCFRGSYYRDLSENNRTRTIRTAAARGNIFDREGKILVTNRPSFDVGLMLEDVPDIGRTLGQLSAILGTTEAELSRRLTLQRSRRHFEPRVVLTDISRETLARLRVNGYRLPGVIVNVVPTRLYPFGALASQLFGFTREISRSQLEGRPGYRPGDSIGQAGIERTWEDYLRGHAGYRQIEVDAIGNRKGELGIVDDQSGRDLYLTVDRDLQRVAEQQLSGKRGAVVVLDPRTGDVLALASGPAFDPNIFSGPMEPSDWERVAKNRDEPLTNRAISQVYPPGSTFKLITTLAALAEKKFSPDTTVNCPGYYYFAGRRYRCHKRTGHGLITMREAFTHSCNAFYFQLGHILGIDLIGKYANLLGLGARAGIDLPGEVTGVVPSQEWKQATFDERWYGGDTLPVSIGQGYIVVSPMQMAGVISTIANGGVVYRPRLVQRIVNRRTGKEREFPPEIVRRLSIPAADFALLRSFTVDVVNFGTGRAASFRRISVGGKTGTAQVTPLGGEKRGERFQDHAWFVAFAPAEDPAIALSVIVENGGHGGTAAAPVAKAILTEYFRKQGIVEVDDAQGRPGEIDVNEGLAPDEDGVLE